MSAILGLNAFHADSAACLLIDGKLVGAVAEERLGERLKHTSQFPVNAIRWLLADNGIQLRDITHVALPRDTTVNRRAKARYIAQHPMVGINAAFEHLKRNKKTTSMIDSLSVACDEDRSKVNFKTVNVEHHLAHIASSYYLSPFEELTAGFSYDASGDFVSAMAAKCEGSKIDILDKVALPDSLGFFYTAMCQFIGFDRFGEEYKVMGLAPYGEDKYAEKMRVLLELPESGFFKLARSYFGMHNGGESGAVDEHANLIMGRLFTDKMKTLFGEPTRREDGVSQREMDIARSTQVRFEEAAVHCLKKIHGLVGSNRLIMAGGCALNGVANARILRETDFDNMYLQAAASDDGTCMGAAYHCWHSVLGKKDRFHMKHAFWGPKYTNEVMLTAAKTTGYNIKECNSEVELVHLVAKLIAEGQVLGWYQGRSEWGPRALGHRSILANPGLKDMKNTINEKIKRRESFRPFAPSVLKEDVGTYFEQIIDSPFMMHVAKIKPEWRERLPAITHVDGTGRLQSVEPENNPLYHKLISEFKKLTGIGMLLNTSFNENEPVVDTPQQAVDCFMRTDMDVLCLGKYVISKPSSMADNFKKSS